MIQIKNILLLTLCLFISACGYHLRGSIDLPEGLKRLYLQGSSASLRQVIAKTLKSSGGELVSSAKQAGVVISVLKEKMERRVLSLSSSGRANEYEIIYQLSFNLLDSGGQMLAEKQKIELSKDYFNNQEAVLAKDNEEKVLREEMYLKAVRTIISRARVALEKQP